MGLADDGADESSNGNKSDGEGELHSTMARRHVAEKVGAGEEASSELVVPQSCSVPSI